MKLRAADALLLARIIDARSPEREVSPSECALFNRLFVFFVGRTERSEDWPAIHVIEEAAKNATGVIDLSAEEAELAAEHIEGALPHELIQMARMLVELRRASHVGVECSLLGIEPHHMVHTVVDVVDDNDDTSIKRTAIILCKVYPNRTEIYRSASGWCFLAAASTPSEGWCNWLR